MAVAQSAEKLVERGAQRMRESVPRLQSTDGPALLDLDESPPGQAAPGSKLVIAPPPRCPQPSELQAQGLEVGIGREDRHSTIRRCRRPPCQCRPLPYLEDG